MHFWKIAFFAFSIDIRSNAWLDHQRKRGDSFVWERRKALKMQNEWRNRDDDSVQEGKQAFNFHCKIADRVISNGICALKNGKKNNKSISIKFYLALDVCKDIHSRLIACLLSCMHATALSLDQALPLNGCNFIYRPLLCYANSSLISRKIHINLFHRFFFWNFFMI